MKGRIRLAVISLLLAAIATFALQNTDLIVVEILFWSIETSLVLLIGLCVTAGAIVGSLIAIIATRSRRRNGDDPSAELITP